MKSVRPTIRVFSDWDVYPAGSLPPLLQHSPEFSSVSNIKHADCVLLPYTEVFEEYSDERLCLRWNLSRQQVQALRSAYARLKEEVHARDVTAIAATHSDFEWQNPIMNSITFQTSLRRSARRERDFALAGFPTSDLASGHGRSVERPSNWTDLPSVGFQGSARRTDLSAERYGRDLATWLSERIGLGSAVLERGKWSEGQLLRAESMAALRMEGVACDFHVATRAYLGATPRKRETSRRSFIDNLLRNQYALCVRGRGNFSYRFYEAMSLSRLPVFIDTDCVLPFDHLVDWPSELVWVDRLRVADSAAILRAFHNEHQGTSLPKQQQRARELFEHWCHPESFWMHAGKVVAGCL